MRGNKRIAIVTKHYLKICLALALIPVSTAIAGYSSSQGASGLIHMRTADTLGDGATGITVSAQVDSFNSEFGGSGEAYFKPITNVTYGPRHDMELGLNLPFTAELNDDVVGLPYAEGFVKYRLLGSPVRGYGVAASLYGALFTPESELSIASGKPYYGGELNLSIYGDTASLHMSIGQEQSDSKYFTNDPVSELKNTINLGVELHPSDIVTGYMELLYTRTRDTGDDNIIFAPGMRFTPRHHISYTLGLAYGVPRNMSQPDTRVLVGINYTFNKPAILRGKFVDHSQYEIEAKLKALNESLEIMQARVKNLESGAVEVNRPTGKETGKGKDGDKKLIRIEVINASGREGLEKTFAEKLTKEGFIIAKTSSRPLSTVQQSIIYFENGMQPYVDIIGDVVLNKDYFSAVLDLPGNIDIRLLIGHDQR